MYTGTSHSCETAWLHASKIYEQHSDQLEREQAKNNARSTSVDGVGRFVALLFTFSVACVSAFGKHSGGPFCCRWISLAFVVHFLHLQSAFVGDLDVNYWMFPTSYPSQGSVGIPTLPKTRWTLSLWMDFGQGMCKCCAFVVGCPHLHSLVE
jgi:hypothetical protein